MHCPNCLILHPDDANQCEQCGFKFHVDNDADRVLFFTSIKQMLQDAYTQAETPWDQSGKSGTYFDWMRLRAPIAEAITTSGTFLDIGCANGFLIESVLRWHAYSGLDIVPYGLDFAPKLLAMAKARLPLYDENLFLGNAWDWQPPLRFDYVRTELVYVPLNLRRQFVERLREEFLTSQGKLLLCQYSGVHLQPDHKWFDEDLESWRLPIECMLSGYGANGMELCRVAVVTRSDKQ